MALIIGLSGDMSSGKGTVAKYFRDNYGFQKVTLSDFIRLEAKKKNLIPSRDNLFKIHSEFDEIDPFYFDKKGKELIDSNKWDKVIIDGIRGNLDFYKENFEKFYLIFVTAPEEIRFKRMLSRGRKTDPKTLEEFKEQEKHETKQFNFKYLKDNADFILDNSKDLKHLYAQIDKIIGAVG